MDGICSRTEFMHQYFIYEGKIQEKHLANVHHFAMMNSFIISWESGCTPAKIDIF